MLRKASIVQWPDVQPGLGVRTQVQILLSYEPHWIIWGPVTLSLPNLLEHKAAVSFSGPLKNLCSLAEE